MAYFGKEFKRVKTEGLEELMDALKVDEKMRSFVKRDNIVTKYVKNDGGSYSSITSVDGKVVSTNTFKLGEEVDFTRPDGVVVKSKYQFDGDTLTQTIKDPEGRVMTFLRKFTDDTIKMTITVAGLDLVGNVEYAAV